MPEEKRIDFVFSELTSNFTESIDRIYEMCFDQKPGDDAKAIMRSYLDNHKRKKTESQPRSLQDFYLTEQDIAFTEYTEMFLEQISNSVFQ